MQDTDSTGPPEVTFTPDYNATDEKDGVDDSVGTNRKGSFTKAFWTSFMSYNLLASINRSKRNEQPLPIQEANSDNQIKPLEIPGVQYQSDRFILKPKTKLLVLSVILNVVFIAVIIVLAIKLSQK